MQLHSSHNHSKIRPSPKAATKPKLIPPSGAIFFEDVAFLVVLMLPVADAVGKGVGVPPVKVAFPFVLLGGVVHTSTLKSTPMPSVSN